MPYKILIACSVTLLAAWAAFCQRQTNLVAAKLTQPSDNLKAAELQLDAVKLAEESRQRVKAEIEGENKRVQLERVKFAGAISNVLSQRIAARKKCAHGQGRLSLNRTEYVAALKTADTAACPSKFRLAWLDYVQTCERANEYSIVDCVWDGAESAGSAMAVPTSPGEAVSGIRDRYGRARRRDTNEAWRQCQRVALEYDVVVRPDKL
jgi:hypothetical protein